MELKPCPFCGCGEAGAKWNHGYWSVMCGYTHDCTPSQHCFQDWGEFETEEKAVEAWNSRADVDAIKNLLTERDAAIEMMRGKCFACKHDSIPYNTKCCVCKYVSNSDRLSFNNIPVIDDNWEFIGITNDECELS